MIFYRLTIVALLSASFSDAQCVQSLFCVFLNIFCTPCNNSGSINPQPNPAPIPQTNALTPSQFNIDTLAASNAKRTSECAQPLTTDFGLITVAQAYAESLAASGSFGHSPEAKKGQYSENLFVQCGGTVAANTAINAWYNEKAQYTPGAATPLNINNVGHYTALVWKATKSVGCGTATDGKNCQYVVCNYKPPGNVLGTFHTNVGCP